MIRMSALSLRIGLGHIRAFLGLAVVVRPIAVVNVARRIDPHQTRTASSRLGHRRSFRRRRSLCGRRRWSCRGRRCSWRSRSGGSLGSSRCSRRSRSCRSLGCSRCSWRGRSLGSSRCGRSLCIPLLHALMSPASPLFAGGSRISSILALSCRSGRRLSHRRLNRQKPRRNRHQTNHCPHKSSR
jgi:hypothetical protein